MGLFSRRRHDASSQHEEEVPEQAGAVPREEAPAAAGRGPWDVSQAPTDERGRVDLGSLLIPAVAGMQLRLDMPQAHEEYGAVILTIGGSTLELRVFAAPRSQGIWDDLRGDIEAELKRTGARSTPAPGPHGMELLAHVPVQTPQGSRAEVAARFIGADGPRWLLRGVLQGQAAVDEEAATRLREVFDAVVVVRDSQARPPRELLPLRAPGTATSPEVEDLPGLDVLSPGPTIAEVR